MASSSHLQQFLNTPARTFFMLWVPVLFSMIAEPLTGLVDTAFVSSLGAEPLAALGVGTAVMTSGLWLFNFLSVGSQTEVSQARGGQDLQRGRRIGSLALLLAGVIGLALMLAAILFASAIATMMGATGMVHDHAETYIAIRAFGTPAVLVTMTSFGILYGLSDMRSPLYIAVTVNVLNIVLDWLLIFGIGPFPAWGIGGAALASAISQWLGAFWCLVKVKRRLGFTIRVELADLRKLLHIGRDMFIRTGSLILFLLLATRSATQIGPEAGAAHQAVRQVWVFTSLFLDASAVTAQSLVGYAFGSARIGNARRVARLVCLWTSLIGLALMLGMLGCTNLVGALLVPATGRALFYPAWIVSAVLQPIAAMAFVTDGIHWGTGDYAFLRNGVVLATIIGSLGLLFVDTLGTPSLTLIWWITGIWVAIRAGLGIVRIWPGMRHSPLRRVIPSNSGE
jgi:MATE family multidrug resistance protein